jgi:ubiquinone/menaquinone biosynthesis C-methylase UbiE
MSESTINADHELKNRHRAMWALGDYPGLVRDLITPLGPALVEACRISAGQRVLDVAAGTGNVAIPAAKAGAVVTATDLTPELLDEGRRNAPPGLEIDWQAADAENLPFDDNSFDVVTSSVGVMFAPHHQQAADELVRVCRPGGTIGVLSWTPSGFIGQMFAAMKPYVPAPPPGAQPPPLWGDEGHVRELFGDRITDAVAVRPSLRVDHFRTEEEFRDYFKSHYGPTIVAYRGIADTPDRVAELDQALAELGKRFAEPDGSLLWEYLLFTAQKK